MAQGQITTERCKATRERGSLSGAAGPDGGQWATGSAQQTIQHGFKSRGRQTSTSRRRRSCGRCRVQPSEGKLSFETGSAFQARQGVIQAGQSTAMENTLKESCPPSISALPVQNQCSFLFICSLESHLLADLPGLQTQQRHKKPTGAFRNPLPRGAGASAPASSSRGAQPPRSAGAPHRRSAPTSGHSLPAGRQVRTQASKQVCGR